MVDGTQSPSQTKPWMTSNQGILDRILVSDPNWSSRNSPSQMKLILSISPELIEGTQFGSDFTVCVQPKAPSSKPIQRLDQNSRACPPTAARSAALARSLERLPSESASTTGRLSPKPQRPHKRKDPKKIQKTGLSGIPFVLGLETRI